MRGEYEDGWSLASRIGSPAALFDAVAHGRGTGLRAESVEVVAGPGDRLPSSIDPGTVWIRRALGEGRLAHVSVVVATPRPGSWEEGLSPEVFLEVVDAEHGRSSLARKISDDGQHVALDSLLLRVHRAGREHAPPRWAEETTASARLASTPTPGSYYQIRRGDTLLGITGRAYGVSPGQQRLQLARQVNDHPFNRRLRRSQPVNLFPQGIISFFPRFGSAQAQLAARDGAPPRGSQYAVIFIPQANASSGGLTFTPEQWESEAEVAAELAAEENSASFLMVPGQVKRIRVTVRVLPARSFTWTSADTSIATVTPLGTASSHPNRVEIRAVRAGTVAIDVRYVAADGQVFTGVVNLDIRPPPSRQEVVDALRAEAIARATRRETFRTEAAVRDAIDRRADRAELQTLFDAQVDALLEQHRRDPGRVDALRQQAAARVVGLLEDDEFRCATDGNRIVIHREVVDAMKAAWTRSLESQSVAGAECRTAPPRCFAPHDALHTSGDASHFMNLSRAGIRVLELAGLWGVDLSGDADQAARAEHAVKVRPVNAPLQNTSVVAINRSRFRQLRNRFSFDVECAARELHVAREPRRQVRSIINGQVWRNVGIEMEPGTDYRVFKARYFEASLHRQWGREPTVDWLRGLANFYRDRTGELVGIGDVSHIVGEIMTDHGSHRFGWDVDIYGLEAPAAGSVLPRSHWAQNRGNTIEYKDLPMPAEDAARPNYRDARPGDPLLAGARATRVQELWVTLLAYCAATHGQLAAAVWHGSRQLRAEAVAAAQRAWDETEAARQGTAAHPGWRETWGPGPANRAAIEAPAAKFIGHGSGSYGAGRSWPLHQNHIHVRFDLRLELGDPCT